MKWIRFLGASLSTFVILFFIISFFLPDSYRVHVTRKIRAPLETVEAEIVQIPNWRHWMDLTRASDPVVLEFDGPRSGPGARLHWKGKSTAGILEVTSLSRDPKTGKVDMAFQMSMEDGTARSTGHFFLTGESDSSYIEWNETGKIGNFPLLRWLYPVMESNLEEGYEKSLKVLQNRLEETRTDRRAAPE